MTGQRAGGAALPRAAAQPPGTGPVLVIEDEADVARAVAAVLRGAGLDVLSAADGRAGLRAFHAGRPSLVVLDIGLPVLDGWQVLDRIRDLSEVPVLVLTSYGQEQEKVRGLRSGADDYVTKPFSNAELVARVESLLRRAGQGGGPAQVYDDGLVRVAFAAGEVSVAGRAVSLTPTEFRLLAMLVRNARQVLSPGQLVARVWHDPADSGQDRVKFAIMRLRRKLAQHGGGTPIEAVRGFGYRYLPPR